MNERLAQYRERVAQYWQQFGKKQRIYLAATAGGLILLTIVLIYLFSRTEYELAFQNLDATDAAAIMEHLNAEGIPYKLGNDGTSISVPASVASRVKVEIGSMGIVRNGSIGFESFRNSGSQFGMTDNEFNVRYRDALNGEVQRLLNSMEGVQRSNVLINLPEESVFLNDERDEASASITIEFKRGFRPTQEQIDAYYNLVKTAVPNLSVENITISSPQGELIASEKAGGGVNFASTAAEAQFRIQRKYESDLKREIQQFLGQMVGIENLAISVNSTLNFDQKTSVENLVQPQEGSTTGVVISEEIHNRTTTGTTGPGGVAGTGETDIPGYDAIDGSSTSSSEETSRISNYEVSRIQNQIVSAPFVVKDLSIGIGIQEGVFTEENRAFVMDYLTRLVRTQLAQSGLDLSNDDVVVSKVSLISQPFVQDTAGGSSGVPLPTILAIAGALAAILLVALFLYLRKRRLDRIAAEEEAAALEAEQPKVELPTIDLDQVTTETQMRRQLEHFAKRKPDDFVNLLRTWLVDE
ncbi:MAG: flagellar M-ring protein FliF [Thermobacillus sp.]|uniref:flagellar basal-body MS-ring/collar protein FliF n=1 Tax=Thermobacillus sp. TaxID=2108467 RepID=UPI000E3B2F9F|nr:flagellar basal-body MS-ring/collar protein FliF [Thermobacillus sp.]REK57896.1 MAG: flagellar M-ring protein FliF [Thermobacillus sp.]